MPEGGDYKRPEITRLLARVLLSLLFLLSAWLKAIDYPAFEMHLLTQVGTGWTATPYLATLLIAVEFALGLYWMNIASVNRLFEHATAALLLFFSVYLGILWMKQGNGVDCGCMGSALHMTPTEALARNFVAAALLVLARGQRALLPINLNPSLSGWLMIALALGATAYTTPPPWGSDPISISKPISDAPLFRWGFPYPDKETPFLASSGRKKAENKSREDSLSSSSGRLTAILSIHCGYCARAADRIGKIKYEIPSLNVQLVLIGRPYELTRFIQEHNLQSTHIFHPPKAIVQDYVPRGVPEIWFTASDGRKWTLSLRQLNPRNLEKLLEKRNTPKL
jgi:hypothetical protein